MKPDDGVARRIDFGSRGYARCANESPSTTSSGRSALTAARSRRAEPGSERLAPLAARCLHGPVLLTLCPPSPHHQRGVQNASEAHSVSYSRGSPPSAGRSPPAPRREHRVREIRSVDRRPIGDAELAEPREVVGSLDRRRGRAARRRRARSAPHRCAGAPRTSCADPSSGVFPRGTSRRSRPRGRVRSRCRSPPRPLAAVAPGRRRRRAEPTRAATRRAPTCAMKRRKRRGKRGMPERPGIEVRPVVRGEDEAAVGDVLETRAPEPEERPSAPASESTATSRVERSWADGETSHRRRRIRSPPRSDVRRVATTVGQ